MESPILPTYWTDPLKVEGTLEILKIKGDKVIVQDLLFYPEGGGQESDRGELIYNDMKVAEVIHVEKDNSQTILTVKWKAARIPELPFVVKARVQADRRKALMRAHTAQHLISAIFEKKGYETIRAEIHPDEFVVELKPEFPSQELPEIIKNANETIVSGKKVVSKLVSHEEARKYQTRTSLKKTEEKVLRIVEIEDTDISFCGGTHLSNTSEIGTVLLTNYGKKFARFVVGYKSTEMLHKMTSHLLSAGKHVATSPHQALETMLQVFKSIREENKNIHLQVRDFMKEIVSKTGKAFTENIANKPVLIITSLPVTKKQLGKTMEELKKSETFIVSTSDNILLIESKDNEFAKEIFTKIKKALSVKGGGAKGKYTLKLKKHLSRDEIISVLTKKKTIS